MKITREKCCCSRKGSRGEHRHHRGQRDGLEDLETVGQRGILPDAAIQPGEEEHDALADQHDQEGVPETVHLRLDVEIEAQGKRQQIGAGDQEQVQQEYKVTAGK